jgi:hypothetical protein
LVLPVPAILRALGRAVRRDLGTLGSFKANNFVLFVALLIYGAAVSGVAPVSAYPFLLLLGFLLLFPLSGDPLAKIPPSRLGVWPLTAGQRSRLRIVSLVLSPVLWLAAFTSLKLGKGSLVLAVPLVLQSQAGHVIHWGRGAPALPLPARLPHHIRNNLRQLFCVLDTYLAVLISLAGTGYRALATHPDAAAFPILAMLVALALSTYTQCLFSLDGDSGATRYALLPLEGRQILLAKDAAFLTVVLVLTLPVHAAAGLTFACTALVVGRYPALTSRLPAERWRFTSGRIFWGALQMVLGAAAVFSMRLCWPLVAVAYLVSLYWGGRHVAR